MMTRKTRLTLVGLLILLLLLLLLWVWFLLKPKGEPVVEKTEPSVEQQEEIADNGPSPQQQQLEQEQETRQQAASATTVAKSFTERYGSYSNEAKFQNLFDLLPLMTDAFAEQTKTTVENATLPETYYGVTTRVLTVVVESMDEESGEATMKMQTQREISEGSTQNTKIEYQEIRLTLNKEAGVWKVDSADWL